MSREKALGQARADLVALPDLVDQLDPRERHHDVSGHYSGKRTGSPALVQLEVVHLLHGGEHKPWDQEDPRQRDMTERYAIALVLAGWVRIVWEETDLLDLTETPTVRSEAAVLVDAWPWIEQQQWATELADDVAKIAGRVRALLGIRPEPVYRCPQCQNPAYLQPGGILACTEVQDHHVVVRDLEHQQRRRPQITTKQAVEEFTLTEAQLWQWKHRCRITPTKDDRGRLWWWPWDVFCLVNPDIAEAIAARDDLGEEALRGA